MTIFCAKLNDIQHLNLFIDIWILLSVIWGCQTGDCNCVLKFVTSLFVPSEYNGSVQCRCHTGLTQHNTWNIKTRELDGENTILWYTCVPVLHTYLVFITDTYAYEISNIHKTR